MEKGYKIKLSIKARDDLKSIILYIKNNLKEPSIAKKYAQIIRDEIQTLEYAPQKFAVIDDVSIKDLNIRKLIIKNYIAFYRINEENKIVSVERILYGASNWINELLDNV